MPARLISLTDEPSILIDKPILLIGRHPECDIQIDSRKISRRHCCIAQVADYLVVRDLASTNGVRINGVRVLEGRLKENDELMIGALRYRVCWEMVSEPPVASGPGLQEPAEPRRLCPPIEVDEDAVLEASDEPVALLDHPVPPHGNGAADSPTAPRADGPSAHLLPEELNLAPPSGAS